MLSAVVGASPCADLQLPVPIPLCIFAMDIPHTQILLQAAPLVLPLPLQDFLILHVHFVTSILVCSFVHTNHLLNCLHFDLSDRCEFRSVVGTCSG